jgi:hypothetical protein
MFTRVVHINPEALRAVYGEQPEATMKKVIDFIDRGRLIGVDRWLAQLVSARSTD